MYFLLNAERAVDIRQRSKVASTDCEQNERHAVTVAGERMATGLGLERKGATTAGRIRLLEGGAGIDRQQLLEESPNGSSEDSNSDFLNPREARRKNSTAGERD
jgi:hypothetical protein